MELSGAMRMDVKLIESAAVPILRIWLEDEKERNINIERQKMFFIGYRYNTR